MVCPSATSSAVSGRPTPADGGLDGGDARATRPRAGIGDRCPSGPRRRPARDEAATAPESVRHVDELLLSAMCPDRVPSCSPLGTVEVVEIDLTRARARRRAGVAEQMVEADGEHAHRGDEADRGGRGQQRGAHRHRGAPAPRLEPEADADHRGERSAGRGDGAPPPDCFGRRSASGDRSGPAPGRDGREQGCR